MDSDEEDEFGFDTVDSVQRSLVYQGGKLNEILAEVETKIPSLDFDEEFDVDGNEDGTQFQSPCYGEKLLSGDDTASGSGKDVSFTPDEEAHIAYSSESSQTEQTCSEELDTEKISQTLNSRIESSSKTNAGNTTVHLDFNKLDEINFHSVKSALCNFISSENSSSVYDISFENDQAQSSNETDLMLRLSDLSRSQLDACCGVKLRTSDEREGESVHFLHRHTRHPFENIVSSKSIHSWTQLRTDDSESKQPKTVFLDLRPETPPENGTVTARKHTSSIQRILGLREQRSATSSDDDSDSDMADWHEMRNKHKDRVFKETESHKKLTEKDRQKEKNDSDMRRVKVESASKRNDEIVVEKLCEQELIGGIPGDESSDDLGSQVKFASVSPIARTQRENDEHTFLQAENVSHLKTEQIEEPEKKCGKEHEKSVCFTISRQLKTNGDDLPRPLHADHIFLSRSLIDTGQEMEELSSLSRISGTHRSQLTHSAVTDKTAFASRERSDARKKDEGLNIIEGAEDNISKTKISECNSLEREEMSIVPGQKSSDVSNVQASETFGGITSSDIDRLIASAVEMLDEVCITRKNEVEHASLANGCSGEITRDDHILPLSARDDDTPLDERTSVSEEKNNKHVLCERTTDQLGHEKKSSVQLKKLEEDINEDTTLRSSKDKKLVNEIIGREAVVSSGEERFTNTKLELKLDVVTARGGKITDPVKSREDEEVSTTNTTVLEKKGLSTSDKILDALVRTTRTTKTRMIPPCRREERGYERDSTVKEPRQDNDNGNAFKEHLKGDGFSSLRAFQSSDSRCQKNSRRQQSQRTSKERRELKERIKEKIESMRPTTSASGKYPAAFNTPIIYDQESSYEPEYHSLLPVVEEQLTLLLVVTLLGCGELNLRSKAKAAATLTEMNCYFALVAWFLSLGSADNSNNSVPFSIIGMQQAYLNGKLQLFVGVQPNQLPKGVKSPCGKTSQKNKIKTFNRTISKYLSTHSLRSVYQNMEKCGSYLVDTNLFSSKMLSTYITVGQDPNAVQRVFGSKPGFFWETFEVADTSEAFPDRSYACENTVVLVQPNLYHSPSCVLDLLCRIEDAGCDLAGLRLAYSEASETNCATIFLKCEERGIIQTRENHAPQHTLALAVRGPSAISKMKDIGSNIPVLGNPKSPPSLRSLYCKSKSEDKLFYCPSYHNQASVNLARWFGGRVSEKEINTEQVTNLKTGSPQSDRVPLQKPPALLVSSTRITFYLICSSLVPPSFLGHVLHICYIRGFSLYGIRRMFLNRRQGSNLGLSQLQQAAFCPTSENSPHQSPNESPPGSPARGKVTFNFESSLVSSKSGKSYPSTVITLQKENGMYHSKSLVKHLSEYLFKWKQNNDHDLPQFEGNACRLYFCTMLFNEATCKSLLEDVCHKPDFSLLDQARTHCFSSNPEVEQVCILWAAAAEAVQFIGHVLKILYSEDNPVAGNWEVLGIKSFPSLSLIQAREVTPQEVGDQSWGNSVRRLMSTAVIGCVLRGINVTQRLCQFMASFSKLSSSCDSIPCYSQVDWWISQTAEVAFRQIAVSFEEKELFSDEHSRATTKYLPPLRQKVSCNSNSNGAKTIFHKKQQKRLQKQTELKNNVTDDSSNSVETTQFCELSVLQSLLVGPRPVTTVALIKPTCLVNTKNLGKVFKSLCQENFRIVALRMSVLTRNEAEGLVHTNEADVNEHVDYLTSGACLLMCLQRENAVKKLLDILGPEDPVIARSLDPFLLRGCYGIDSIHNAIHGSESYRAALCEIRMLFPCGLCCDQTLDLEAEQIPCRALDETVGKITERKLIKRLTESSGITQSLVSSLVQINCLVLTHRIVYGRCVRQRIALVDVLECLLSLNFMVVGMKMALLSVEQIDNCLNLVGTKSSRQQKLKNELTEGPCIVIALQRDNAITCFDTILESAPTKYRSLKDYRKHILEGATEEEARNLLLYFFDGLAPNCAEEICGVQLKHVSSDGSLTV